MWTDPPTGGVAYRRPASAKRNMCGPQAVHGPYADFGCPCALTVGFPEWYGHEPERIGNIRLFGSAARGDWQESSDVDVLIVLDAVHEDDRSWIAEHATRIGILGSGILVSTVTLRERDFEDLRRKERLFVREIEETGVPL